MRSFLLDVALGSVILVSGGLTLITLTLHIMGK